MKKIALFVFNGDAMCFIHVLLNALNLKARGYSSTIILEGASVKLVPEFVKPGSPLFALWKKCLEANLVGGVCQGCAAKLGTLEATKEQKLTLLADMSGHPGIAGYLDAGYEVITF